MAQSGGNTSCAAFGGVFGAAGDFASGEIFSTESNKLFTPPTSTEVLIENCSNEVALSFTPVMVSSGGPKFLIGGVVGASTAHLKNCNNTKDITIVTQPKWIVAGGIVGLSTGNLTACSNTGVFDVDADKDNHPSSVVQQHYIGGIVGYIWKGNAIDDCHNTKAVSLKNVFTTPSALSYLGGLMGSYSGAVTMNNCSNSGDVSFDADDPICLGGIAGAFNGTMAETSNSGKVDNKSSYTAAGKEAEVGGLVGYANATFINCSSSGSVYSASPDGATGGMVGGFGEADKTWYGCDVDAPVSGPNAGSVFGWYRKDSEHTITLGSSSGAVTITEKAKVNDAIPTVDNLVGKIKNGHVECVNVVIAGNSIVTFSEDLENNKFTYAGKEYPIIKLADNRYWMAAPLAYVPAGKKVSSNPVEDTGIWYTYTIDTDKKVAIPSTDRTDAYLYDFATALGVERSSITYSTSSAPTEGNYRSFEGSQGICPPGWYIPTRADFLKLVGNSNKDQGESAAIDDNTAVYYEADFKGSSIARFNAEGWNFSFLGARNKTSTSATGSYNATDVKATFCSVPEWLGKCALNQIMTSSAYQPNATGTSFQIFVLMSTFSASYEGRLNLSYAQFVQGVEVRCIRKAD